MGQSPIWDFSKVLKAVEEHAAETGRAKPRAVLIFYEDNSIVEVKGDGRTEEGWGDTPGPFPALAGWSFRAGVAAYNGTAFRLGGLRYRLLRSLVDGRGDPVRDRVLKMRIWAWADTDDARLKGVAFELRAVLRSELHLDECFDPIERVEGGYRIAIA